MIKLTRGAANLLRHCQRWGNTHLSNDHPDVLKRERQAHELFAKGLALPRWDTGGYVVLTSAGKAWIEGA